MDLEQKKQSILEASKKVAKYKLDPKGKGKLIKLLEEGKPVSKEKVNELYAQLLKLKAEQTPNQNSKQTREITEQTTAQTRLAEIENRLKSLEDKMMVLEWELKQQRQSPEQVEKQKEQGPYGFTIIKTTTKSKGKTYKVYKAYRGIKGTELHVYIGREPNEAKEKIKAYLNKNREGLSHILPVLQAEYPTILL